MPNSTTTDLKVKLSDEEREQLEYLVEFFQTKSIATLSKSDVIKALISRTYLATTSENLEKLIEFYATLGIDVNFKVD